MNLNCIIYDEIQNICGEILYQILIDIKLDNLIGFSATPFSNKKNKKKIEDLIKKNTSDTILFNYKVKKAIDDGCINKCMYHIIICKNIEDDIINIINIIKINIEIRKYNNTFQKKKIIGWIPENLETLNMVKDIIEKETEWVVFGDDRIDDYKKYNCREEIWCLIVCRKCREGFNSNGIEFGFTIGHSEPHINVQQGGRTQRKDYSNQTSELFIFTHHIDYINELESYLNEYLYSEKEENYIEDNSNIEDKLKNLELIKKKNKLRDIKIKLEAMEAMNEETKILKEEIMKTEEEFEKNRKEQIKHTQKEKFDNYNLEDKYKECKKDNKNNNIMDDSQYNKYKDKIYTYIENPKEYFGNIWINWYDFLGIETPIITKNDFKKAAEDIWIKNKRSYDENFQTLCKKNNLPYFDFEGLFGDTLSDNFFGIKTRRKNRNT